MNDGLFLHAKYSLHSCVILDLQWEWVSSDPEDEGRILYTEHEGSCKNSLRGLISRLSLTHVTAVLTATCAEANTVFTQTQHSFKTWCWGVGCWGVEVLRCWVSCFEMELEVGSTWFSDNQRPPQKRTPAGWLSLNRIIWWILHVEPNKLVGRGDDVLLCF